MSLDLSWSLLDETFTAHLLATFDKVLSSASKPDFIGPIHVSTLQLGNEAPEVSIVDIGDVWQGFLERDDGAEGVVDTVTQHQRSAWQGMAKRGEEGESAHFAKFAEKNLPFSMPAQDGVGVGGRRSSPRNQRVSRLQTYRQYSNSVNAQLVETGSMSSYDPTASRPTTPASSHWGPGLLPADRPFSSHGMSNNHPGGYFSAWQGAPPSVSNRSMPLPLRTQTWRRSSSSTVPPQSSYPAFEAEEDDETPVADPSSSSSSSSLPSVQLHLSLHWNTSSIRMAVNTSLLINHPSPAFMSLPLSITITGLVLQAGGLLAFEVDQITNVRRGHFCLVAQDDEEDDGEEEGGPGTEQNETDKPPLPLASSLRAKRTPGTPFAGAGVFAADQQMTPGERILSNINLETSVGQADKHVLRNVAKVERFVVSLVRKAIGDEVRGMAANVLAKAGAHPSIHPLPTACLSQLLQRRAAMTTPLYQ